MREFSVSSTTEVTRSPFTDTNEQRSDPASYSSMTSPPCNCQWCQVQTTTLSVWRRGCIISTLIESQFCSILCPLKPNGDHSWQILKYFNVESPVTTNTLIFWHDELLFFRSLRPPFMYYTPDENGRFRLKNLEQQTCLDHMLLLKMSPVYTLSFGSLQTAQTVNQTCPCL